MGEREERVLREIERVRRGGPPAGHDRQKAANKLFVRDRLKLFFDDGEPYTETGQFARSWDPDLAADGIVSGTARINGRLVFFTANDFTVKAGSIGSYHAEKQVRTQEAALRARKPMLYLIDSSGARIDEVRGQHVDKRSVGRWFYLHSIMSGAVPQIGVLYGTCFAGTAYTPVFCDVLIMLRDSAMAIASPRMVEVVIGQKVSAQELGGAEMHAKISGSAHFVVDSEEEAAALAKKVLSYFPDHCDAPLPVTESKEPARDPAGIDDLIPEDPNRPYDMHRLIESLVDADSFLELKAQWAGELIVGFGRIGGRVVGIVANNPMVKVGAIFPESSDKGAEFVWLCDAYGIPLVYLCDTPGFMAGTAVERNSILRRGRKFIFATSSATVPRVCVVVRKAYGAGIYAMSGPAYDPDVTLGLPSAEIAVMGPHAAINAVYYNKLAAIADPQERERVTAELREDYRQSYDIFKRAGELVVDELILPRDLRKEVLRYIEIYREKQVELPRRKHGAIL